MKKRRIAILYHERERRVRREYMVHHYARFWRNDGHEVCELIGLQESPPADLLIMHVDLSVVPEEYLAFARRYPIVINGAVRDIRKKTYSTLSVGPEGYDGKVIVKSNYNYGGVPERMVGLPQPRGPVPELSFKSPADYRIYDDIGMVPRAAFDDPNVIVEKFRPEFEDGLYHVRLMVFLGSRAICTRLGSNTPIVNGGTKTHAESVEPDPRVLALAHARGFQFGKFDYVMHEGEPIVFDMNKTVGAPPPTEDPKLLAGRRHCAEGLYAWFD